MPTRKGLLLVISGPSGVGKGTICKALFDRNPKVKFSVSATTRARRPGEVEGVNYFFKTREEFERMIEADEFLEYMLVFGTNYYGTPRRYVEDEIDAGHDIILEIDVNGALKVKKSVPEAVTVFIAPPSYSDLKSRLINRSTEPIDVIDTRLETAKQELLVIDQYDYVVVNDIIDKAVREIEAIVMAEKARTARNLYLKDEILGGIT